MMQKFLFNSQKCTSTSSLSGCKRRFLLKAIIALPTQAENVDLFKQTLIGGFSWVTRGWDLIRKFYYQKIQKMNRRKI